MTTTIQEPARDVPVFAQPDVLVVGGGLAGFAAALASARTGAKTVLLERNGCLGGVACATMMGNIGNRYMLADGSQVIRGIAAEVVDRLAAVGAASPNWNSHKAICIDSERLKVVLIELLDEAGVTTLTHSLGCAPITDGSAVKGAFFESKSGRQAILASNTVDCSGEADIAHRAGAKVNEHRASSTLLYKLSGVNIDRFVAFLGEDPDGYPKGVDSIKDFYEAAALWRQDGVFFFPHHGGMRWRQLQQIMQRVGYGELRDDKHGKNRRWIGPAENIEAFGMYTHRRDGSLYINTGYYCFDKIEIGELSRFELHAQKLCYYATELLKKNIPGFENAHVEHIATDLGLRGGRYITGRGKLRINDLNDRADNSYADDVIATAPIRSNKPGVRPGDLGSTCDIPFGSCVPVNLSRLLVGSGKSVDTEGINYRINRGMSGCMVYGQATGTAAALASRKNTPVENLPIRAIQRELLQQGVHLGSAQRLQQLGLA